MTLTVRASFPSYLFSHRVVHIELILFYSKLLLYLACLVRAFGHKNKYESPPFHLCCHCRADLVLLLQVDQLETVMRERVNGAEVIQYTSVTALLCPLVHDQGVGNYLRNIFIFSKVPNTHLGIIRGLPIPAEKSCNRFS